MRSESGNTLLTELRRHGVSSAQNCRYPEIAALEWGTSSLLSRGFSRYHNGVIPLCNLGNGTG